MIYIYVVNVWVRIHIPCPHARCVTAQSYCSTQSDTFLDSFRFSHLLIRRSIKGFKEREEGSPGSFLHGLKVPFIAEQLLFTEQNYRAVSKSY